MVIGIVVALPIFQTWYEVIFGEERRRRRWLNEVKRSPGVRPGVLIIDVLPKKSIEASVRKYLAETPEFSRVGDRIQIVKREKPLTPDQMASLAEDIRHAYRALLDASCDIIHLFHGGPDVSALLVGAELSNGPRVILYHYDQGKYVNYGPLEPLRYYLEGNAEPKEIP